jgi:predicted Zn-dependent protease with MMP-like domain
VGRRRGDRQLAGRLALLEAQALDDLGHPDEALNAAESAITLDPTSVEGKYERAVSLFHLCRFDKARASFEEVLKLQTDDPFAHHHLGLILEREGRLADAEQHLQRATELARDKFAPPVLLPVVEFQALVDEAVRQLEPETRKLMSQVAIEIADLPALEDLTAVDPPFAPTILGLYRGAPLGAARTPREAEEPRAIVLYRKNLARAVTTRGELAKQVRITLLHEIGHLRGEDEDELRARGLE